MTARYGQTAGSAVLAGPFTNGAAASKERSAPFSWEDWFSHASPQQRAAALGLAQEQGLLYPHQLPPITNGVHPPAATAKDTPLSQLLTRVLAGKAETLPRQNLETLTFFDADLDALQQQAVVRAISTPDLFLLQGLPGTGKSRVLTEIVRQAAVRGRRVLFVASHAASLDVVLERLVGKPEVFALRWPDSTEKPESLSPWLRGFTLEEQKQAFIERTLAGARADRAQVELACRQRTELEPCWTELGELSDRLGELSQRLQSVQDQLPLVRAVVNSDADFAARLAETQRPLEDSLRALAAERTHLQVQLSACESKAAGLAADLAQREPGYWAKKNGRFWTPAFWTHAFNRSTIADTEALLRQQADLGTERRALAQRLDELASQEKQQRDALERTRQTVVEQGIAARREVLEREQETLESERRRLDEQWTLLCARLGVCLAERTRPTIAAAQEAWLGEKQQIEQQCQFAQQWTSFVEQTGPQLAARLPSLANLLAVPLTRWHGDLKLREAVGTPVDLLIVEDADALTESDILKLSRHAQRAIFAAAALAEPSAAPIVEKTVRSVANMTSVWNRLWQAIDGDAGRWPHSWRRTEDRLICRLMPLTAADQPHLESERLADAADIELRILQRPRTKPCLAEVHFPATCSFEDAFRFMVREVQEFPLEPLGRTGWWSEDAESCRWRLGPAVACVATCLEIEPGLRLIIAADAPTKIACIEFDKSAGWERAKAETWLHPHRPAPHDERTAFLQTPYRFERRLARLVQTIVRAGDWVGLPPAEPANGVPALEFTAVPALAKPDWPTEGAGLEFDLSASRSAGRLPAGLRPGLPSRGVVNYLEAQELVRRLESWMRAESPGPATRVAVLALHASQVELLRRLIDQSEAMRGRTFTLEVALPTRLHQRECDAVFLSLTRSQAQRSVAFGDDARELPLALTRARSRLFIFGDPGCLCKRATWTGPVDSLDAHASHQEQVRLARLLAQVRQRA